MKKTIALLLVAFMTVLHTTAQTADEIIDKHFAAIGGKAKLASLKTMKFNANIEIMPGQKAPVLMTMKDGNKMRFDLDLQGMKMTNAFDGTIGWMINPFGGKTEPERMPEEAVKELKKQADFQGPLFDYQKKGSTVKFIGKEDMEGTEVYKLQLNEKDGDVTYYFIDAESHLLLKESQKVKIEDKETETSTLMSNYKMVDGLLFPFTVESRSGSGDNSQGQAINIEAIEINIPVEDKIFMMPAPAEKK